MPNMDYWKKFKKELKEFHTKKPHIEFFTALLTVPVLLTVIILNLNNLKGNEAKSTTPTPIVINQTPNTNNSNSEPKEVIVTKDACKEGIGEVSITHPDENEKVSENPLNIDIDYDAGEFCNVVWSYRVNNGTWSSYDDRSIALYNLASGDIKFELRVKSVIGNESKTLTRRFIYESNSEVTPTASPTPTQ